jgi:murein L,D-transpeptidase YafK
LRRLCAGPNAKAIQPLKQEAVSRLSSMGSSPAAPMMIRIFKETSELEVWKQAGGSYKLFKTYEICAWSGTLGPKIKEGDRQSPEGFYTITPGLMNPNSNYYLAFNTGFPNKFDRAYGRTGSDLMVHGDCSSRGCYSMTDESIAEIYALARETFKGGNPSFQLQIYPFRMTVANLARHADNPHMSFGRTSRKATTGSSFPSRRRPGMCAARTMRSACRVARRSIR